jgi:hypothetical protein
MVGKTLYTKSLAPNRELFIQFSGLKINDMIKIEHIIVTNKLNLLLIIYLNIIIAIAKNAKLRKTYKIIFNYISPLYN